MLSKPPTAYPTPQSVLGHRSVTNRGGDGHQQCKPPEYVVGRPRSLGLHRTNQWRPGRLLDCTAVPNGS